MGMIDQVIEPTNGLWVRPLLPSQRLDGITKEEEEKDRPTTPKVIDT